MEKLERLKEYVETEWQKRVHSFQGPHNYTKLITDSDSINHVIEIGCSVLMTKWPEIGGYPGGSFVQAVVDNDLMSAFSRADNINIVVMKFYVELLYNFSPDRI